MKKNDRKITYICLSVCILAIVIAVCTVIWKNAHTSNAEYMLVCSYDFNDPAEGYNPLHADSYNDGAVFSYSETDGMDGSGCIVIELSEANDARFTYTHAHALENTYYRMSVWVKTENVGVGLYEAEDSAVGANISVINTYYHSQSYTGDTDWTYIEYYGRTGDGQESFTAALRLGFYGGMNIGKVYFDDFVIEQLDALPSGASANSMEDTVNKTVNAQAESQYHDTMLAASIMVAAAVIFIAVAARYAYIRDHETHEIQQLNMIDLLGGERSAGGKMSAGAAIGVLIAIGLAVRIVMSFTMPQCDIDVNLFQYWGLNLVSKGIPDFYASASSMNLDYPPLFMYFLYILGAVGNTFNITQTVLFDALLKLPSIAADCVIAYIIYKLAVKRMSKNWTLFIVSLWLFNPVVLLDSACWGQVDSILALALLLSAYYIETNRYGFSAAALAFAVTLKPQGIFFVPILGYALLRQLIREKDTQLSKRLLRFAYSICAFFITAFIIVLPFGFKEGAGIFNWIINLYKGTANGYSYATVNSFNFFYMLGANWVKDSTAFMGLTYLAWGIIFIVIISLLTGVLYIFGKNKNSHVYLYASMLIYAVAIFGPRMHERYFYPAVVLLLAAVIYSNNKALLGIYAVLSISNFYTVLEVMTGLSIGSAFIDTDYKTASYYYWPPLNTQRGIMGLINVFSAAAIIVFAIVYAFYKKNRLHEMRIWTEPDEAFDYTDDNTDDTTTNETK